MQLILKTFAQIYKINWSFKPNKVCRPQFDSMEKEEKGTSKHGERGKY